MKKILLLLVAITLVFSAYSQNFSDDFQDGNIDGWITVSPNYATNPYNWHISDYDGDYYLRASSYKSGTQYATEQWVISPSFNIVSGNNITIKFKNRTRFVKLQDLELYLVTDFTDSASFESSNKYQVTINNLDTDASDYNWVDASIDFDCSTVTSITGNLRIAFKYVSDDSKGGVWDVNNVVVENTILGVDDVVADKLAVYPNPVVNTLNIAETANVEVYNLIGEKLLEANNVNSVDVSNLESGIYLVKVSTKTESFISKVIKK